MSHYNLNIHAIHELFADQWIPSPRRREVYMSLAMFSFWQRGVYACVRACTYNDCHFIPTYLMQLFFLWNIRILTRTVFCNAGKN